MTTDTSKPGLERLICTALTGYSCDEDAADGLRERPAAYGAGWICGDARDYDRDHCLDLAQLGAFLKDTQPETAALLSLEEEDPPTRRKFLARLRGEINRRGTVDLLRKGLKHGPHRLDLFYGTPLADNAAALRGYQGAGRQAAAAPADLDNRAHLAGLPAAGPVQGAGVGAAETGGHRLAGALCHRRGGGVGPLRRTRGRALRALAGNAGGGRAGGGLAKAHALFGEELGPILEELDLALAA